MRIETEDFRAERTSEAGEAGAERKGQREHPGHIDAEADGGAGIIHRRAQTAPEPRAREGQLQRDRQQPADDDDHQPVAANADTKQVDLPLQPLRQVDEHLRGAHHVVAGCDRHEDEADREQDLIQMGAVIQMAIEQPLQHEANGGADQKRKRQAGQERHAVPVDEDRTDVAARHRERAMREVDEIHQPKRHREPARQHEQQHAVGHAVEQNGEKSGQAPQLAVVIPGQRNALDPE